jgi:hypothetical protein
MNNGEQQERLALARRLRLCGVPLEIPEDDHHFPHSPRTGLFIRQIRASATQFNPWEAGYWICLRIVNNLPSVFWICGFRLQLPWQDENLFLLDNPGEMEPARTRYHFLTTPTPSFPRGQVLNHHHLYKLSRGCPLEGWLLWSGEVPIPEQYAHGSDVAAFVAIVDQFGRPYSEPLSLRVDRRPYRRELRRRSRRNITGKAPGEISREQVPESSTGAACEAEEPGDTRSPAGRREERDLDQREPLIL